MEREDLQRLLVEHTDAWNSHDVDRLMRLFADDCVFEASGGPESCGRRFEGREQVRAAFVEVLDGMPDANWGGGRHFVISDDYGVSEWRLTGTLADGARVDVLGCDFLTVRGDQIVRKCSFRKQRPPGDAQAVAMAERGFRMGRLDHVHIRVPNRAEAAAWYHEHLGFEPVERFRFWAEGFEGGPLQISADGGQTTLALFEASDEHPMAPHVAGIAFNVDADTFVAFARSLPGEIESPDGRPLTADDVVDFDLCFAFNFADPWGNQFELNCYDYDRIRAELIERDGVRPERYWPVELYDTWRRP